MRLTNLRVYHEPDVDTIEPADDDPNEITVSLGEILPLLADGVNAQRGWVEDFEDEDITIPADLYGVLLAYRFYHAPPMGRA